MDLKNLDFFLDPLKKNETIDDAGRIIRKKYPRSLIKLDVDVFA